jgi:MFS family permease
MVGTVYTVLWAAVGLSHWLWVTTILLFAVGVADGVWSVMRNTIAQLVVTDALRGRVMSIVMLVTRGSAQLGRVQSGVLVGLIGAPAAVLVGSGVIGLAVLSSWQVKLSDLHGKLKEPVDEAEMVS